MDGGRRGRCNQKLRTGYLQASPKRADHTNTPTAARFDVQELHLEVAAAAGERGGNKVDPVAGKALIEKKSQKKQVRQERAPWDQGTRIHHRSHDDPGRDVRRILLGGQVWGEQVENSRPNGDV